jgi:membrane-associated phospholipid phosphatase
MRAIQAFRQIGFNGPIIVIVISLFVLWNRPSYWILYIFGLILNIGLNTFLKQWIKQPRPDGHIQYLDHPTLYDTPGQNYGMPSGHAELVIYTLTFLFVLGYDWTIIIGVAFFAAITVIQRFVDLKHTAEQLLVGSFVGGVLAWGLIYCKKILLRGKSNNKII